MPRSGGLFARLPYIIILQCYVFICITNQSWLPVYMSLVHHQQRARYWLNILGFCSPLAAVLQNNEVQHASINWGTEYNTQDLEDLSILIIRVDDSNIQRNCTDKEGGGGVKKIWIAVKQNVNTLFLAIS